jgi:pimeloyl-ACP methyl ester carboxylesterase
MTSRNVSNSSRRPSIRHLVEGRGPFVTLVHGVGASLESWDEVARRLAPRFTVVRMDLRGHGQSSPGAGPQALIR